MHGFFTRSRALVAFTFAVILPLGAQDEKQQAEDAGKKAVEEFKKAIGDAKTLPEKALAIQAFGEVWPKHNVMVPPLGKYLAPSSADINFLLPVTAADALAKFRNNLHASQTLTAALAQYKKNPYVYSKVYLAIGKVGHESCLAMFEEPLKGKDPTAAVQAVEAIAELPAGIALESLFRESDRIEKEKGKASDDIKKVFDKVLPEILKAVKKISGQPYPTFAEQKLWWAKKGAQFKEESAAKEKERQAKATSDFKPGLPPTLLVELVFKENGGESTANTGASAANFAMATLTKGKPAWSTQAPPNGGPASLEFSGGPGAVDLGGGAGVDNLKGLKSFTITGWLNCRIEKETAPANAKDVPAGSRILSWLNGVGKERDGVELVHRANGSLQIGINQWADQGPQSKPSQITPFDEKATDQAKAIRENWKFFAVTYDSGAASGHVKFYFANTPYVDPKLVDSLDGDRGPVGMRIAPTLSIGNTNPTSRTMAPDRAFKGFIDEVRIFGSTIDSSGALGLTDLIKVQNRPPAQ
jgi:hypothetical protein